MTPVYGQHLNGNNTKHIGMDDHGNYVVTIFNGAIITGHLLTPQENVLANNYILGPKVEVGQAKDESDNAPKTYTAKEMREAFKGGVRWTNELQGAPVEGYMVDEAYRRYPDPVRLRTVSIGMCDYRFNDGQFEQQYAGEPWVPARSLFGVNIDTIAELISLRDRPTEPLSHREQANG